MSPQTLVSVFCLTVYFVSTVLGVGLFIAGYVRKAARKRALRRRSCLFPCGNCRYFTGEVLLACAVNPAAALTDAARNCQDFECHQMNFR